MTEQASSKSDASQKWGWLVAGVIAASLIGWSYVRTGGAAAPAPVPQLAPISAEDRDRLTGERHRLLSALERDPAISARGLASPEAIAENEQRFAALSSVSERLGSTTLAGAPPSNQEFLAAQKQETKAERDLYAKSRELLEFLRTSWGKWKFDDGPGLQVQFASEADNGRLKDLADRVRMAQVNLNRADDTVHALTPLQR